MKTWFWWSASLSFAFLTYNYFLDLYIPATNPAFYYWKELILILLLLSLSASGICIYFKALLDLIKMARDKGGIIEKEKKEKMDSATFRD